MIALAGTPPAMSNQFSGNLHDALTAVHDAVMNQLEHDHALLIGLRATDYNAGDFVIR